MDDPSPKKTQPNSYRFVIRFVGNEKDLYIPLKSSMELEDVSTPYIRRQIRDQRPDLAKKRLKLIHNGRVLMNHTDFGKELKYYQSMSNGDQPVNIYIHCMIGEDLTKKELAKEEELERQPKKTTTEAPRGFDRFLSQGFSRQDVEDLRRQFRQIHSGLVQGRSEAQMQNLEDRWIDSSVNNEIDEFPANLDEVGGETDGYNAGNGTDGGNGGTGNAGNTRDAPSSPPNVHRELFVGVCIGFFLGVFALLLMGMQVGGMFKRTTKMAIISGVIVNISFGVLKAWSS